MHGRKNIKLQNKSLYYTFDCERILIFILYREAHFAFLSQHLTEGMEVKGNVVP